MEFFYQPIRTKVGTIKYSPRLPIIIGDSELDTFGLVDSGADISVIPLNVAKLLNINIRELSMGLGVGGPVKMGESSIKIKLKSTDATSFDIPIRVSLSETRFPILLGRQGFFDNYKITFLEKEKRISLEAVIPSTS